MTRRTENWDEYYTQTQVKGLGFSSKMIAELLPEPMLRQNPRYKSAPEMKLWKRVEVDEVVESEAFSEYRKAGEKRRAGAKKAVEAKRSKLHAEVQTKIADIHVRRMDINSLQERSLRERQDWYNYQDSMRGTYDFRDVRSAEDSVQRRWMVNYVRHNLTQYDDTLYEMSGKVGCRQEYQTYKEAVLDKITEAYPELASECRKQKLPIYLR